MINHTYFNKLNKLLKLNKKSLEEESNKEKERLLHISDSTKWGLTTCQKEYLQLLDEIIQENTKVFRFIRLKKISNKIRKNFDYKVRIVFFCYEYQTFPTFKSTYDKMKNDDRFICDLVHIPFYHVDKKYNEKDEIIEYKKNGYSEIKKSTSYQLTKSNPDVAFYLKPYDLIPKEFYIDEIKNVIEKCIYIPYGMEVGACADSPRYQFQLPLHDEAWFCVSYCNEHYKRACKYSKSKGNNFKLIGHPRMDLINLDLTKNKEYIKIKKMAKGRKIFMWNPHFTIGEGDNWGTFLTFGNDIIDYFAKHKNLFLIYRPHPLLKEELINSLSKNEFQNYQKKLQKNKDNIYLDETGNYLNSMHLADYLISDANSFVPEFLMYEKPVIYTKKVNTSGFKNQELEEMLYTCTSKAQLYNYINDLSNGNDPLKVTRKDSIKKVFKFDDKANVADKIILDIIKHFK